MASIVCSTTLVLAGVAGLTACAGGSGAKSNAGTEARALADESVALMRDVDDFKLTGSGEMDGTTMSLNFCVRKGTDAKGTITIDGATVEVVVIGKDQYMKADAKAWAKLVDVAGGRGSADAVEKLDGKYMKVDAGGDDGFGSMADPFEGDTEGVTKGDPVTVEGVRVIPLTQEFEGDTTTVYVRATGKPYPVVVKTEGSSPSSMRYTKAKARCEPVAPPADLVVDMSEGTRPDVEV